MRIYLVEHGETLSPSIDPGKPLSPRGKENIEKIAKFLGEKTFPLSAILHSQKLRAKQTAEILQQYLAPELELEEYLYLNPDDSIERISIRIESGKEDLLIVSHLPLLNKLLGYLLVGDETQLVVNLKPGTIVCLSPLNGNWLIDWVFNLEMI